MTCPTCGADLPADAQFCIECGAALPRPANTGATVALPREGEVVVRCAACGAASPVGAAYCIGCGTRLAGGARAARRRARGGSPGAAGALSAAILLGGLALLMLLKLPLWPLLLIVVGLAAFVHLAARGRAATGVGAALWLFAVVFLVRVPRLLVPGLIALALIAIVSRLGRRRWRTP